MKWLILLVLVVSATVVTARIFEQRRTQRQALEQQRGRQVGGSADS